MSENVTKLHAAAPAAEEKAENSSAVFKPKPVELELNGEKYTLVYDLNAFCEMETMYDSVDTVINMLMGTPAPDISKVTYCDAPCQSSDIKMLADRHRTKASDRVYPAAERHAQGQV